jgi:hypothetical protein
MTLSTENLTPLVLGIMVLAGVIHCFPSSWFETSAEALGDLPFWVQGLAMAALILMIQTLAGRGSAPFVYGKF